MLIISASVFNNDEDKKKKYPLKQEKSEYFKLMENQVQKEELNSKRGEYNGLFWI